MVLRQAEADPPPTVGRPGVTQGRYGERGNLELVVPAASGGFWVFWWNADPVDHRSGAVRGRWSGGLHRQLPGRGDGDRVARIAQVRPGPDFLEVLALRAGAVRRLHWTPQDGFVDDGDVATGCADVSAPVEAGAALVVLTVGADGGLAQGSAALGSSYPDLAWTWKPVALPVRARRASLAASVSGDELLAAVVAGDGRVLTGERPAAGWRWGEPAAPEPMTDAVVVAHGSDARLVACGRGGGLLTAARTGPEWSGMSPVAGDPGGWTAVAAAATNLDGEPIVVVGRRGGVLWQGWLHEEPGGLRLTGAEALRSRVWLEPGQPVHRG